MSDVKIELIYKIETKKIWDKALSSGTYSGAPIDVSDGFIHFSTAAQARETAAKHFAGVKGLIIATFSASSFGSKLKWELSRGGALFPHLYGVLDMALVVATDELPVGENGQHLFPDGIA